MQPQSEGYVTRDFYLACFLCATGYSLADLTREGNRTAFVFSEHPPREVVLGFFNSTALVEAGRLVGAIKDLRALLYSGVPR